MSAMFMDTACSPLSRPQLRHSLAHPATPSPRAGLLPGDGDGLGFACRRKTVSIACRRACLAASFSASRAAAAASAASASLAARCAAVDIRFVGGGGGGAAVLRGGDPPERPGSHPAQVCPPIISALGPR